MNSPLEETPYRSGRVIRQPLQRTELTADRLKELYAGLPRRMQLKRDNIGGTETYEEVNPVDEGDRQVNAYDVYSGDASDPLSQMSFFTQLKSLTKPTHNWLLLHLLFWVYLGLIFPGAYLLARRNVDYRWVYGGLLGLVVLFGAFFGIVGQRGYGETTAVNSVSVVRPMADGFCDVAQWTNVFATQGGLYRLKHEGTGTLYSTTNTIERVRGVITNGAEAEFAVDIPPFSNREFAHRSRQLVTLPRFKVQNCQLQGNQLTSLDVQFDRTTLPEGAKFVALAGDKFYPVGWHPTEPGRAVLTGASLGTVASHLQLNVDNSYNMPWRNPWQEQQKSEPRVVFERLEIPLLRRGLNVSRKIYAESYRCPPGIVRLCAYLPATKELEVRNNSLGKQLGQMLVLWDLPVTPAPADTPGTDAAPTTPPALPESTTPP